MQTELELLNSYKSDTDFRREFFRLDAEFFYYWESGCSFSEPINADETVLKMMPISLLRVIF